MAKKAYTHLTRPRTSETLMMFCGSTTTQNPMMAHVSQFEIFSRALNCCPECKKGYKKMLSEMPKTEKGPKRLVDRRLQDKEDRK
jgi:hypothetical protein